MRMRWTTTLALVGVCLASSSFALDWVGNTRMTQSGGQLPYRGAFLEPWQNLNVTTETWPISSGQRVVAVVTTNNWISTQEFEFSFQQNVGNNTRWSLNLPAFPQGSQVQFYIRASRTGQAALRYDSNAGANFAFLQRHAPRFSNGTILQWFATDYRTIMLRLPEVIEAGYSAIYLPGPTKAGSGGFSAGYDPLDRFDLGDRFQKGTVRTAFGTTQELLELIRVAKRLGLEVYCDLLTNHNANRAAHPINQYPDMIPEDFHIRSTADTANTEINFNNENSFTFGMLNHDLVGLADIAHEDGNNTRTGTFTLPPYATFNAWDKPSFVRNATVPQLYPNNTPVAEDVRELMDRWVRWLAGTIGFDGFRIDAVKHTPPGYFGWAPDQAASQSFTKGNLIPRTYAVAPNAYFFGEDYTSNSYELREYAKTGMNLLDFPLAFALKSVFNANGLGNLGAALANGYASDPATGLFFQQGGLTPDVGVAFVQSHDDGPPASNNIAHAFILGRPGRAKIYYDGNNIQPGNWANFPRPGRYDALGNGSDLLTRLVEAHSRFGRGYSVNRFTSADAYVFERQVNGKGLMLVGLNDRGNDVSETITVQTGFEPGTILVDASGQRGPVTVAANRNVTINIPPNFSSTEPNNGRGYVMYVPQSPEALPGSEAVQLLQSDGKGGRWTPLSSATVNTPGGTFASGRNFRAFTVTQNRLNLRVRTNSVGHSALVRLNNGVALPGWNPQTNTPEGLGDGFVPMSKSTDGDFSLQNLDLSGLEDGLHLLKVRVFANTGSNPGVFTDFNTFFFLRRGLGGNVQVDGLLTDLGTPVAEQFRPPSSNLNRVDAIYATNDHRYLYLGLAGRVDGSGNFTNGMGLAIDVDGAAGVRDLATLNDDSGPAARLLSNTRIVLPNNFGADFLVGVFRNSSIHSSPETPFVGGLVTPPVVGAMAGAFKVNPSDLRILQPLNSVVASQIRVNRADTPRGAEIAIPLANLFPNGLPANPGLNMVAWLGTTGEKNSFLPSSDPMRAALGGRPAPESFVTNQFIPFQSAIANDPGTGTVNVANSARFNLQIASVANPAVTFIEAGPITYNATTNRYVQSVQVDYKGATSLPGPIHLRVTTPTGVTLANRSGVSLVQPNKSFITTNLKVIEPDSSHVFRLEYTAPNQGSITPSFEFLTGRGAL